MLDNFLKIKYELRKSSFKAFNNIVGEYHRTPLVQWSLHKYECLWSMGGKGRGSSI